MCHKSDNLKSTWMFFTNGYTNLISQKFIWTVSFSIYKKQYHFKTDRVEIFGLNSKDLLNKILLRCRSHAYSSLKLIDLIDLSCWKNLHFSARRNGVFFDFELFRYSDAHKLWLCALQFRADEWSMSKSFTNWVNKLLKRYWDRFHLLLETQMKNKNKNTNQRSNAYAVGDVFWPIRPITVAFYVFEETQKTQ